MKNNFLVLYILLVAAQMLICNYLHLTPYLMLTLLPTLVLCLPTKVKTAAALLIAFATGLSVDLIAEGALGINTVALLPVALLRRSICDFIFGEELVVRGEDFSIRKYGLPQDWNDDGKHGPERYIEAHVWSDRTVERYLAEDRWCV